MKLSKKDYEHLNICKLCGNEQLSTIHEHGEEHLYCAPQEQQIYDYKSVVIGCGEVYHNG